jgi:hypothetical protein
MSDPFEKIADEWDREHGGTLNKVYDFDEERFSRTIEEQARKNAGKTNGHAPPVPSGTSEPKPSLSWIDTSRWDSDPCPEREWAIKDRVPLRQVTLFSGEGAIGKSIAELMCSVAHASLAKIGLARYLNPAALSISVARTMKKNCESASRRLPGITAPLLSS